MRKGTLSCPLRVLEGLHITGGRPKVARYLYQYIIILKCYVEGRKMRRNPDGVPFQSYSYWDSVDSKQMSPATDLSIREITENLESSRYSRCASEDISFIPSSPLLVCVKIWSLD